MNVAYNMDCLEAMRKMPDNAFDLAVVDPPYGSGLTETGGCKGWFAKYHQDGPDNLGGGGTDSGNDSTDTNTNNRPLAQQLSKARKRTSARGGRLHYTFGVRKSSKNYENRRAMGREISKKSFRGTQPRNRNILKNCFVSHGTRLSGGGNYFDLPPTRRFIIFRKTNIPEKGFSMAPVEYAWTSFWRNAEIIDAFSQGKKDDERFHPTQKPVKLYAEIYERFAKKGDKILDTHLGSGSSRIAAWDAGLDFVGYEIDKVYFDKQEERFRKHTEQLDLFHLEQQEEETEQMTVFDFLGGK